MPEGPEVKNLTLWLNKKFRYKKILNIKINSGKYKKNSKNLNTLILNKKLFPLTIDKIDCKGKFIYFLFKNTDIVLFVTLGMTGWFELEELKHNHIQFNFNDIILYFNDFRNFGNIIVSNKEELEKKLLSLGADILNSKDNFDLFNKRIERKRDDTFIASALLDQKVSAGVGNYIRAEALYIAKISPYRKIKDIDIGELKRLWNILKQLGFFYYNENIGRKIGIIDGKYKLINKFKKSGPSKYKPEDGKFLVYRQTEDSNGNKVTSEKLNNRTIHYVKKIQK
jgi:DNA-formamidopyrimidine glycosylase